MGKNYDFSGLANMLRSAESELESATSELGSIADDLEAMDDPEEALQELKDQVGELEDRLREQETIWMPANEFLLCVPCKHFFVAGGAASIAPCPRCANPAPIKGGRLVDLWVAATAMCAAVTPQA